MNFDALQQGEVTLFLGGLLEFMPSGPRKMAAAVLSGRATKKSAASDPLTKLRERLVRGERLTEDELVQLELAAVSKYDTLSRRESNGAASSSSSNNAAAPADNTRSHLRVDARPPVQARPPLPSPAGLNEPAELRELRELRMQAQQGRASSSELATELQRLRQLREAVSRDPQAALAISTNRLEASYPAATACVSGSSWFGFGAAGGGAGGAGAALAAANAQCAYRPAATPAETAATSTASSIQKQLRATLTANRGKVLDLFRTWDTDADGTISAAEMRRAMVALGVDASPAAVDALFASFDRDGGGAIEYNELHRVLRRAAEAEQRLRHNPSTSAPAPPPSTAAASSSNSYWPWGGAAPVAYDTVGDGDDDGGSGGGTGGEDGEELALAIYGDVESGGEPAPASTAHGTDSSATGSAASRAAAPASAPLSTTLTTTAAPAAAASGGPACPSAARSSVSASSEPAKAKAKAAAKPKPTKPMDPTAERELLIWRLYALIEASAPWATWHAAESLSEVRGLAGRPAEASSATSVDAPPRPSLPPTRSALADAASLAAILAAAASITMQLAAVLGPVTEGAAGVLRRHLEWSFGEHDGTPHSPAPPGQGASTGDRGRGQWLSGGVDALMSQWPLHAFAALAMVVFFAALLRQLCARMRPAASGLQPISAAGKKATQLPISMPAGRQLHPHQPGGAAAPFVHWSTLAATELALAAYVACWADTPLLWPRRLASASAITLVVAACYRGLWMLLWHCRALSVGAAPPASTAPPKPAAPAASKPAGAASAKGKSARTTSESCVTRCCGMLDQLRRSLGGRAPAPSKAGARMAGPPKGKPAGTKAKASGKKSLV